MGQVFLKYEVYCYYIAALAVKQSFRYVKQEGLEIQNESVFEASVLLRRLRMSVEGSGALTQRLERRKFNQLLNATEPALGFDRRYIIIVGVDV